MQVELRNDSVFISGYVNAVERLSKPIKSTLHGKIQTFLERIRAGVFRNSLKRNANVNVLLNHDENRVLATTQDGNAILEEDNIGLRAEITITDEEVIQKARQGKLSGWSFGFIANDDELSTEGNDEIRTITDLDLLEVSILDDTKAPAYYGTSIEAREGGAKMVEVRADAFEQEQTEPENQAPTISIDELATLVANKVIEALKTEEKADEEEPDAQAEGETEEQTEPEQNEEQSEETTEDETEDAVADENAETETEEETEESRSIDYSSFELRLANLKK